MGAQFKIWNLNELASSHQAFVLFRCRLKSCPISRSSSSTLSVVAPVFNHTQQLSIIINLPHPFSLTSHQSQVALYWPAASCTCVVLYWAAYNWTCAAHCTSCWIHTSFLARCGYGSHTNVSLDGCVGLQMHWSHSMAAPHTWRQWSLIRSVAGHWSLPITLSIAYWNPFIVLKIATRSSVCRCWGDSTMLVFSFRAAGSKHSSELCFDTVGSHSSPSYPITIIHYVIIEDSRESSLVSSIVVVESSSAISLTVTLLCDNSTTGCFGSSF